MAPYAFSLELAVLASTRGLLDLEHWATDLMTQDAVHFVTALLAFMDVRIAVSDHFGYVHPQKLRWRSWAFASQSACFSMMSGYCLFSKRSARDVGLVALLCLN